MKFLSTLVIGSVVASAMPVLTRAAESSDPEAVVREFIQVVRSGRDPDAAAHYFAPKVAAHQLMSEGQTTVARTPDDYAAHVRQFRAIFGDYALRVEELIAQKDRVYVRWKQDGHHRGSLFGEAASGAPLTEISSAVYRVQDGRIVEYWIQLDRKGLELQLERISKTNESTNPAE